MQGSRGDFQEETFPGRPCDLPPLLLVYVYLDDD